MCLGVPGKIIAINENQTATADIENNRMEISIALTPEVKVGDFVLIHAGFAMDIIDSEAAAETLYYLKELEKYAEQ